MRLRELNEMGGTRIEETLKAASVFFGYCFFAETLVRIIDAWGPEWWINYVVPFVVSDWVWGVYVVFGFFPLLLGVLGFVIYRPRNSWAIWSFAPVGVIVWLASLWFI